MDNQGLVVYATKYGATAEIAERIGQVLHQAGLRADVVPVGGVSDLTPYRAVVLGSAVYIGQWRKGAVKFLRVQEKALTERQTWLFSSGPTGEGDAVELTKGWRFLKVLEPIVERIRPRGIAVFHGKVEMKKLNLVERWMLKNVQAPVGDFRDWEAITSWAKAIADAVSNSGTEY
jgi:menaquinone-dependent protoporphyrinogen oxidase